MNPKTHTETLSAKARARWKQAADREEKYGCELRSGGLVGYPRIETITRVVRETRTVKEISK